MPGRGHARPGTAREACPEILRVLGARLSRVADFSQVLTACPCGIFTKPRRLSRHFPPAPRIVFPKAGGPPVAPIRTFLRPILELLAFPRDRWPPCRIFTKPWRQARHFVHIPEQSTFPRACACGIFTDGVWYFGTSDTFTLKISSEALSPVLGKSPQRRLCVGQALGLRSAWPSKTLPGQGP